MASASLGRFSSGETGGDLYRQKKKQRKENKSLVSRRRSHGQRKRNRNGPIAEALPATVVDGQHLEAQPGHEEEGAARAAARQVGADERLDAVGDALVRNAVLRQQVVGHEARQVLRRRAHGGVGGGGGGGGGALQRRVLQRRVVQRRDLAAETRQDLLRLLLDHGAHLLARQLFHALVTQTKRDAPSIKGKGKECGRGGGEPANRRRSSS